MLLHAWQALKMGFHVHPVRAGTKKPLLHKWQHLATRDPKQVAAWWEEFPEANVGIVPARSNLAVIDVDGPEGDAALESFELPPTVTASTPSGGRHLYYQGTVPSPIGFLPKVDCRSERAYVLGPGSRLSTGEFYRWEQDPLEVGFAQLPAPLREVIVAASKPKRKRNRQPVERIPEGARNSTLTSWAGGLRRMGCPPEGIRAALQGVNQAVCTAPLPEKEVDAIAKSAEGWDACPWSAKPLAYLRDRPLTASARLAFMALAAHANHEGRCRPTGRTLAALTGFTESYVMSRAIPELEGAGLISVQRSPRGSNRPNLYTLL